MFNHTLAFVDMSLADALVMFVMSTGSSGVNKSSNSVHRVLSPHRDNAEYVLS